MILLRPIYTSEVTRDREGGGDIRHLRASAKQREVRGKGDRVERKYSILLPSPLPSPFVDLHSHMQVSHVSFSISA